MDSTNANDYLNLENQIKTLIDQIDTLKEEIKNQKQMYDDSFQNDTTFKEHDDKVKEASKIRQATKAQILKQGNVAEISEKIIDSRADLKGMQNTLSELLIQYQKESGATQIESNKGEILRLVNSVKLVKESSGPQE
ncbi:MAG: hypothetical protein BWY24_00696 [Microgenomates group bacterium ADurb.Bin219]|nr:MAG: hypothetical protein BWY24_00696 [Microgenomates group bacterium ADurb.Bin219]